MVSFLATVPYFILSVILSQVPGVSNFIRFLPVLLLLGCVAFYHQCVLFQIIKLQSKIIYNCSFVEKSNKPKSSIFKFISIGPLEFISLFTKFNAHRFETNAYFLE